MSRKLYGTLPRKARERVGAQIFGKKFVRLKKHLSAFVLESKDFSLSNELSEMRWKSTWLCSSRFQLGAHDKKHEKFHVF